MTKKQVREVLSEVQQSLQKYFVPAKVSNINKSPSLGFLSSKTLPWNYGVGGKTKGICSSSQGPNRKLCEENKEKEMRHSMSMIDINELTKLLNTSNRSTVNKQKVWYKGLLKRLIETSGGLGVFEGDLFKVY